MSKRITILPLFIIITLFILSLFSAPSLVRSAVNHIVISEIQISGDGGANDEFIELYNPINSSIDISGWSIQRETITGSFSKKNLVTPANIPAYGYYLIANTAFNNATLTPDLSHSSFTLSSTGATIFLVNDHTLLTTGDELTIVDKVGIGESALDAEGGPFETIPSNDESLERKPGESDPLAGNGEDTDNNSVDFVLRTTSNPQNTSSPGESPSETPTPTTEPTLTEGPTPTLTLTPTPTETPTLTPTPTSTPTLSVTPTLSPTPTSTSTPSPTLSPTPTSTPTPTVEPSPSPTQTGRVIGRFLFPGYQKVCRIRFIRIRYRFLRMIYPVITCK